MGRIGPTTAPTAGPDAAGYNSANSSDSSADDSAVVIAVILILICLCSVGLLLFRGLKRRQRDDAKASQAHKASVQNPEFTAAAAPSMQVSALWEQGTNVTNVDSTSLAPDADVYVSTQVAEARRSSAASIQSNMSVSSTATDWGDGSGDGMAFKTLGMSGTSRASLVSNRTVFGYDPNEDGGTLSRMHEPIVEGSEMPDGVPVARLATKATAGCNLLSAKRVHHHQHPAGGTSVLSDARTAVNPTYQPQAPVFNPGRTAVNAVYQSQHPTLQRDDPTGNAADTYVEVEPGDVSGDGDTYAEVAPENGASVYDTLGITANRPPVSSGGMYASLGAPVAGNTVTAADEAYHYHEAAVRFDGNAADCDYEALAPQAEGNYGYEIPSGDATSTYGTLDASAGPPESDAMYAKLSPTTAANNTYSTLMQPAVAAAGGGGPWTESDDVYVELGATAAVGSTYTVLAPAVAAGGKDHNGYAALASRGSAAPVYEGIDTEDDNEYVALAPRGSAAPAYEGVDTEEQPSDTGSGSVYSTVTPTDLKPAGYDSPAPAAPIYKGVESEKQLRRLRTATSTPDCEEPAGEPMYAEPTHNVVPNHYEGAPPLAAGGPATGLGTGKLDPAVAKGDPDPAYKAPVPPSKGMPSAGGSVRGVTAPQYSAPPEYMEPDQEEPEYAAVDDSAPVPAAPGLAYTDMASPLSAHTAVDNSAPVASEFTYTDMAPPQAAHAVDDDEEL